MVIKGLSGGKKQVFLKQHRAEIQAYYRRFGAAKTCEEYNMEPQTLERFLNSSDPTPRKNDRAVLLAEIANERSLSVLREVEDLRKQYFSFIDSVSDQIMDKLLKPLLRSKIELPAELEVKEDARLKLGDLGGDFEAK